MINKSKVAFWAFIVLISMVGYLPAEEPDYGDDYATAEPVVTDGTIVYGTIDPADDADLFTFTPPGNARYEITMTNQVSNWKTIRLYQEDQFGNPINVIYRSAYNNVTSMVVFLDSTRPCYLRVDGGAGNYAVKVELLGTTAPDGYSDTCAAADTIVVDAAATVGTIAPDNEPETDEDWLQFETQALHMYQVTLTHTENSWVRFRTYDGQCNPAHLYGDATTITVVSWYGEDYCLQVVGDLNNHGNYYEIQVEDIGTFTDDHQNTYDVATAVTNDGTENFAAIEYNATLHSDEDWFSFACPGDTRFQISFNNSVTNWKTIELYHLNEFDVLQRVTYFSVYNNTASQTVFLDESGTHFLRVTGGLSDYAFSVTLLDTVPPDSFSDTCESAGSLIVDDPPTVGTISPDGDVDWFSFATATLHKYQVTLTHTDNSWVRFRTYDGLCSPGHLHWDATAITLVSWYGDDFSLQLVGDAPKFGNWYNIVVQDLGQETDDYGNTFDVATSVIRDGSWIDGQINYTANLFSDEDWFKFVAPIDGAYLVGLDNGETNWKEFRLYQTNQFGEPVSIYSFSQYNSTGTREVQLTAGTHYIRINGGLDDYRVSVLSPEPRCGDLDHPYPPGDANEDCMVNLEDLALMAEYWMTDARP